MTYTKAKATILLAGVLKSIERKWEPLASGKFSGRAEPACALCPARDRAFPSDKDNRASNPCYGCPIDVKCRSGVSEYTDGCCILKHPYSAWRNLVSSDEVLRKGTYNSRVNSPRAVKAAGRVLASLRRAEKKLRKVVAK